VCLAAFVCSTHVMLLVHSLSHALCSLATHPQCLYSGVVLTARVSEAVGLATLLMGTAVLLVAFGMARWQASVWR
jgi:hypothetical protein